MPAPRQNGSLLSSWKEIAVYMGRSVRTVQRWEEFGLPVRRLSSGPKSAVMAKSQDIDMWLSKARAHGFGIQQSEEHIFLRGSLAESLEISRALRAEMVKLREERRQDMITLTETVRVLEKSLRATSPEAPPDSTRNSIRPRTIN